MQYHDEIFNEEEVSCDEHSCKTAADRGASMVEYALLLALIAIAVIGAVAAFGGGLGGEFSNINSTIDVNIN